MNNQENPESLLQHLPAFRTTQFTNVRGWKNLLVDAGLDLWALGQRHGVTLTCRAAMAEQGRMELAFDGYPPSLKKEVEEIQVALGEATGKCCQDCGKPAVPTMNGRGHTQTRCPACLAANRRKSQP